MEGVAECVPLLLYMPWQDILLNPPPPSIVAVHGLGSTPKTAWESRKRVQQARELANPPDATCPQAGHKHSRVNEPNPNWLRDFLPAEKLGARIMAFNHNTAWKANALSKSLEDYGQDLLRALSEVRLTDEVSTT